MKAEDFKQPGERAKRLLRVAQALTVLSKSRAPSLSQVNDAITRLKGRQPAVAMALLFEYAKRRPLHERIEWLNAAQETLKEYRLSENADKEAANLVSEYLTYQFELCKTEIQRQEKMRERISMIYLGIVIVLILGVLGYILYSYTLKNDSGDKKPETPVSEKIVSVEKTNETKSDKDKPSPKSRANGK